MTGVEAAVAPTPLHPALGAGRSRLRVVALVDRAVVPAWVAETLAAVADADVSVLVAVCVVDVPAAPRLPFWFEAFLRLDARLAPAARIAMAPSPLATRLPGVGSCKMAGVVDGDATALGADDLAKLRAFDADLLIGFGLPAPSQALAATARLGAWFFERRATDPLRAGLRFLEPIWRGDAVTPTGVVVRTGASEPPARIGRSWCATSQLSFSRNRAYQLLRIPAELVRVLRRLAEGDPVEREPAAEFAVPGPLAFAGFALRLCLRAMRRHLPRLGKAESWVLGIRRDAGPLDPSRPDFAGRSIVQAPAGRFWADPFVVRHDGRDFVFVEEYLDETGLGRIAVLELDDGKVAGVRTVLEHPWHLSYPFVFDWEGTRFLLVESSQAKDLTLYRCVEFPHSWEPAGKLFEGRSVVDATPYFDGTRWYLFLALTETPFDYDQRIWCDLFVFWADDPRGPWHPHKRNPVVSDVRCARPAGALFVHEGRLIRPAQDCSIDYGYAVVFNEVLTLDPHDYAERAIGRLPPDWLPGLRGCHTYQRCGGLEVVDGKVLVPKRWSAKPSTKAE